MLANTSLFFGHVDHMGLDSGGFLGIGQLMVQHWCLKFIFSDLSNSESCRLLPMASFFLHWYFGCGWTDWDSQYLSWEEVYCATIALDRYSLHLGKIHYIQDGDLCLYMQHQFANTWKSTLLALSLLLSILLLADFIASI